MGIGSAGGARLGRGRRRRAEQMAPARAGSGQGSAARALHAAGPAERGGPIWPSLGQNLLSTCIGQPLDIART